MAVERFVPDMAEDFSELIPEALMKEISEGELLCFVCTLETGAAAVCVAAPKGRRAELRWMMVREDLRKKGIGTDLLLDVLIRLREEGFTTFTLQVLPSEAPGFIRLAERFAMKKEESGKLWYTLKLSDAEPLASVKGDRSEICSMKDISREDGFLAMERIEKDFPKQGQRPFSETDLDPELTLLKFDDVGLCAGLFVEKRDGKLYLAYLFNDSDELLTMEGLLSTAWEKAVKEYPGNTPLSVAVMDEKTEELMNRIPKAKKEAVAEYTMDLRILDILTEEDVA